MKPRAIDQAIAYFQRKTVRKNGGRVLLAKFMGIAPSQLTHWDRTGIVPAHHVPALSKETGIPKKAFRPDLWKD